MGKNVVTANKRKDEVYEAIVSYTLEHNYSPSVNELAKLLNRGRNTIEKTIWELELDGKLIYEGSRAINLIGYKFVKE